LFERGDAVEQRADIGVDGGRTTALDRVVSERSEESTPAPTSRTRDRGFFAALRMTDQGQDRDFRFWMPELGFHDLLTCWAATAQQKGATREDRAFFACRFWVKPVRANRKGAAQGRFDWLEG